MMLQLFQSHLCLARVPDGLPQCCPFAWQHLEHPQVLQPLLDFSGKKENWDWCQDMA